MRQWYGVGGGVVFALTSALLILRPSRAEEKVEVKKESGKSASAELLPVAQVVLFSSGVGYFQREGSIDGTQRVDLTFPVQDINDLLKSMTLRDLDGGQVTAVSYDSNAPVEKTLKSFAINLTGNPNLTTILNQARGEKVEVVLQSTTTAQPGTMTGSIVGVEVKTQQVNSSAVTAEFLNLWCADGLRSVKMSDVQRVRFLNALMESEFKKALETVALSHDTQKKAVSISFAGQGKRNVKVGYVVENPIWKTSYRLVLGTKKDEKPFLQGWAIVDNPTDEDWSNVRMALISGRPISFQMNLYDPLFLARPVVEPELFASLRPVTYSGGLDVLGKKRFGGALEDQQKMLERLDEAKSMRRRVVVDAPEKPAEVRLGLLGGEEAFNLQSGVTSVASATKLGDYFQYAIDHSVTLPRQKSAMLPILSKNVEGERVSIFNEGTHAKFPLLGLVFKNTSGMHLMQGPITVFDGGNYAGDSRILDLQKDERRLLSYAIDLGTEVHAVPHHDNGKLTSVKIVKGIIHTKTKLKESKTYTVANRNEVERVVLIEHPHRTDFTLTSKDKPWETARDFHRFEVKVPAGKTVTHTVAEERDLASFVQITNSDDQGIKILLNDTVTSDKVKDALKEAQAKKWKLAETQRETQQKQRELNDIVTDQNRLRQNLREMPPTAEAYKRYLKKFDTQEVEIEGLQKAIKEMQQAEHQQRKDFDNFLANLSAE